MFRVDYNKVFTRPNEYWKLPKFSDLTVKEMKAKLLERNYDPGSLSCKEELQWHLQRTEVGLQSYKKLTNPELKDLIDQRGIPGSEKGGRGRLLEMLNHADQHRRFARFMDLPTEVRSMIYGFYFDYFMQEGLHAPKQPPITLVSSLVRKETLPMFYSTFTFDLNLLLQQPRDRVRGGSDQLKMRHDTREWLHSTRNDNLADIQHVRVRVFPEEHYHMAAKEALVSFSVDRSKAEDGEGKTVRVVLQASNWGRLLVRRLDALLVEFAKKVEGRGGRRMEREDFFALRRAVEMCLA